jgi:hypothetical protein
VHLHIFIGALGSFDMIHETKRTMGIVRRDLTRALGHSGTDQAVPPGQLPFDQLIRFYPSGAHNTAIAGSGSCVTITSVLRSICNPQRSGIRIAGLIAELATARLGRAAALVTPLERHVDQAAAQPRTAPSRRLAAQQLAAIRSGGGS